MPDAVDPVEQLHDADGRVRVEVPGRLVADEERRVVDDGARDRDALLLAARELVGKRRALVREADEPEHLGHLLADRVAALALHLERVGDVVVRVAVRQELEVLEHALDVAAQHRHLRARQPPEVAPADDDAPARRLDLLEQQLDDRRLARARGADDEHEVALVDHERDVAAARSRPARRPSSRRRTRSSPRARPTAEAGSVSSSGRRRRFGLEVQLLQDQGRRFTPGAGILADPLRRAFPVARARR